MKNNEEGLKVETVETGPFAGTVITQGEGFEYIEFNAVDKDNCEPFEMLPYPYRP